MLIDDPESIHELILQGCLASILVELITPDIGLGVFIAVWYKLADILGVNALHVLITRW